MVIIDPKTREASDIYQDLEVELLKKPGKGLGLSVVGRRDGNGVFISDMVRQTIIRYYSGDPIPDIRLTDFKSVGKKSFNRMSFG